MLKTTSVQIKAETMKIKLLIAIIITLFISCEKTSSPDGRAKLRDAELSQRIDRLEKKQIVILDSLQILKKKIESLN